MQPTQHDTANRNVAGNDLRSKTQGKKRILAVTIAVVLAGVWWHTSNQKPDEKQEGARKRSIITVKRGPATLSVLATGLIKPVREVKLSPKQTGLLMHLYVKQGDTVKKGQVIAQMDDSNLRGQVAAAEAAYKVALDNQKKMETGNRPQEKAAAMYNEQRAQKALGQTRKNITRLEAQVTALRAQLLRDASFAERQKYLATSGAVSDQAGLDAETAASVTKAQLTAAEREKEQAIIAMAQSEADLKAVMEQHNLVESGFRVEEQAAARHQAEQALGQLTYQRSLLNDTTVRAPFDGVITQKYTDSGAIVTPTTSAATTSATSSSIVALSGRLELVAQVAESNIPRITIGHPVEVTATAYPDKIFKGRVTQIAPAAIVTQNVTTFEVHAAIDDPKHELLSGMNVSAHFVVGEVKDALTIPSVCVVSRRDKLGVFVPDEKDEPEFKPIKIGQSVGKDIVVTEGLEEGEKVFMGLSRAQLTEHGYADEQKTGGGLTGGLPGARRGRGGGGRGGRGGF